MATKLLPGSTACHPALPADARAALTLRVVGGLTTDEIARAFLTAEPTIAQRIVRAKKTIAGAGLAFETPRGDDRAARLASVLEVIYLIFNEGYAATVGEDLVRPALCLEALRLGRILAGLVSMAGGARPPGPDGNPGFASVGARGTDGALFVPLTEQNCSQHQLLIRRGLDALARAQTLDAEGPQALQAALAACHARAKTPEATDWPMIAGLYDRLRAVMPSPVVDLNRAVAYSMAFGPEAGLKLIDEIADAAALRHYPLLPAARGICSAPRAGRGPRAVRVRRGPDPKREGKAFLLSRAAACN